MPRPIVTAEQAAEWAQRRDDGRILLFLYLSFCDPGPGEFIGYYTEPGTGKVRPRAHTDRVRSRDFARRMAMQPVEVAQAIRRAGGPPPKVIRFPEAPGRGYYFAEVEESLARWLAREEELSADPRYRAWFYMHSHLAPDTREAYERRRLDGVTEPLPFEEFRRQYPGDDEAFVRDLHEAEVEEYREEIQKAAEEMAVLYG